ncbi:MAG: L,D-transpeptidase family protein [Verrucomicrobia bacterium]|nr:L,D-transpeptidase family protein [Verrucomicrobiota bacterium]
MKRILILCLSLCAVLPLAKAMQQPSFHTKGSPTGKPTGQLKPGEYWWAPYVSPSGPVVVLVSVPLQVMHVYRNGVLVGRAAVSTGAKGHATPSGVFTILEKSRSHYSKTYNNAPMPNMQRLTWNGIAMHSGQLPGYPASHGCIRMPYDFSMLLFNLTAKGGTVVIGDETNRQPHLAANPGMLLAPNDFTPAMVQPLAKDAYDWRPSRSPGGPITVLLSAADRTLYVYRNGIPIGRAAAEISGFGKLGDHVFTMLEGVGEKPSWWVPDRTTHKWMTVTSASGRGIKIEDLAKRVRVNPEFAGKLYDAVTPGATVIVTDQALVRKANRDFTILSN